MKSNIRTRLVSGFLAAMMGLSCFSGTAIAAYADDANSEITVSSTAESDQKSVVVDDESAPPENAATDDVSETVKAFLEAVDKINYESIIAKANSFGLAQKKWEVNQDDKDLEKQLDEVIAELDEATQPLYTAEDAYSELSEDEKALENVAKAYAVIVSTYNDMTYAQEHPTNGDEAEIKEVTLEDITANLYSEMPDKPTGYYVDDYGMPVATGETKVGIGEWSADLLTADNTGHLDAEILNDKEPKMTAGKIDGEDYAIVPVMVEVEYPTNGSSVSVDVPEGVNVLSFLSTDNNIITADDEEKVAILNSSFDDSSAVAYGFYLISDHDFEVTVNYNGADGNKISKAMKVSISDKTDAISLVTDDGVATQADAVTPPFTTGKITKVEFVRTTWLIWFNGQEAYCCDNGLDGQPNGCPPYSYSHTSKLEPGQYTGDHYTTQISVWGGLSQLSLDMLDQEHNVENFEDSEFAAYATAMYRDIDEDTLKTTYQYYNDTQLWIIEHFPESIVAKTYMEQAGKIASGIDTYLGENGYYTFAYIPSSSGWQRVVIIGPEIQSGEVEIPDMPDVPKMQYYATKSGSFDYTYNVASDKIQRNTYEKIDDVTIDIDPVEKSGTIDGGSWSITPASKQTVTTSGHTNDNDYHKNGGDAFASWSLHYSVEKSAGPCDTQAEADSEAQSKVDSAISAAKNQLSSIKFKYDEVKLPYGFEEDGGEKGSHQTISVPHDDNSDYVMNNDEWSLKVNLDKTDSETGNRIAADSLFEVYEWDVVTNQYIPYSDYNMYSVDRNADGTYSVRNHSDYADTDEKSYTMYYTQRNCGKFIIVETKAPDGYFGDWTDPLNPGVAGTPLGKRAYYIEITKANDGSVITLDNKDYSADIATSYTGGIKLLTSGGVTTTVTVSKASEEPAATINYKDPARSYDTDNSKKAANEDEYRTANDKDDKFQNDRVLGEISLSKVDLDAVRYVDGRDAKDTAIDSGESHGDAVVDGAIYDLYAAEDIQHPDGVSGTVDYSKIIYADGTPIWTTTIRENSGHWEDSYLPVLAKDNLVASAKIVDGWVNFSNLYLGRYYIVERGTGVIISVEATTNAYHLSGTYPEVDSKTKEFTGNKLPLASKDGQYTDYVYKNQYYFVEYGKNQDSRKTYDGVYLSYSKGYLCDEHNYYVTPTYSTEGSYVEKITFKDNRQAVGEERDTTVYSKYYNIHKSNDLAESQEQVMKADIELAKRVSSNGESNSDPIEGAGFTLYLISDLSKADQIATSRSGKYLLNSLCDLYVNDTYDQDHPKWDFSGETQAIAKTYECDPAEIAAYNESLTDAGDFANGKGDGWVPTGNANEYQLSEIFSNDTGDIRVWGLPYGQYLLVETTVPEDKFQADPVIVDVDPDSGVVPVSRISDSKGAVETPSGSYMKYTILNELVEAYLRIVKVDDETGKPVLREGTAFQLYWIDDNGNYILDKKGNPRLVTMTATADGSAAKKVDTFYTTADGIIVLPEKLEVGRYRIVEVNGPEGFYNEWIDTAQYGENGILLDKGENGTYATGNFYVDFAVTTNRIYEATGDLNEDNQDNLLIEEEYHNNETLGMVRIRKTGEVLTGFKDGKFTYEEQPLAGAEFKIIATEDILTQDNQVDANGNRTVWYKVGDVVATVTSGDGTADTVVFAPTRTKATYDFLSVIHDGELGEVKVTLPLGKYKVVESKPPYGYVLNETSYDVEFNWTNQVQDVNFSTKTKQTVKLESDMFEVQAYSRVTLPFEEYTPLPGEGEDTSTQAATIEYRDCIMGDVKLDGQITEEDAQMIRDYLDEQTYMKEFAQKALDDFNKFITEHPDEPIPTIEVYEPQHLLTENQMILANVSNNKVENMKNGVTYADAENISAFAKGEIDRMPYTMNHPETELRDTTADFENTRVKDADEEFAESQVLKFVNDREKARVGVFKFDIKTNKFVSGAIFEMYTDDDIYNANGDKIFSAGDLVATSPETNEDGYTYFDVDIPIRGENYKNEEYTHIDNTINSGNFTIVEVQAPDGYYLNKDEMHVSFTYDGEVVEVLDSECKDVPTTMYVSKRELTGDDELPGATLTIKDKDGNVIREWVSTTEKHEVNALSFKGGNEYTLTETRPADGYALASDITFKLVRRVDDDGNELDAVDVYYKSVDDKNKVTWTKLDDETVIMHDDITRVKISKKDITNNDELEGAKLKIKDNNGNTVESWTSKKEPHYIEKLPAGDYTLIEETAPNGYLKAEEVKFTVKPIGDIQVVTMYDKPDDYGLWIHKVDAVTKQPIEGIAFQIINADTGKIMTGEKDGVTYDFYRETNEAGNIWFALPKGNYYYQEIKVTPEYLCNSTLYPFSITDETRYIEIEFENVRSPLYGIIEFFKGGRKGNLKTGTLANGEAIEEINADSVNTGATVVTSSAHVPVAIIAGIALLIITIVAGAVYFFTGKRKALKPVVPEEKTE